MDGKYPLFPFPLSSPSWVAWVWLGRPLANWWAGQHIDVLLPMQQLPGLLGKKNTHTSSSVLSVWTICLLWLEEAPSFDKGVWGVCLSVCWFKSVEWRWRWDFFCLNRAAGNALIVSLLHWQIHWIPSWIYYLISSWDLKKKKHCEVLAHTVEMLYLTTTLGTFKAIMKTCVGVCGTVSWGRSTV